MLDACQQSIRTYAACVVPVYPHPSACAGKPCGRFVPVLDIQQWNVAARWRIC
jgi:hypothetical protein